MTHKRRGFSVSELSEVLGVSNATIYHELNSGKLGSIQMGKGEKKHIITDYHLKERFGFQVGTTIVAGLCDSEEPSGMQKVILPEDYVDSDNE